MRQLYFNFMKKNPSQHHEYTKKNNLIFIRKMEKLFKNNPRNSAFSSVTNKMPRSQFVRGLIPPPSLSTSPFQFLVVTPEVLQTGAA